MLQDAVPARFVAESPMAVAVRGTLESARDPTDPDAAFERIIGPRSDRRLAFSTLVNHM